MFFSINMRCMALLPLFVALAVATTGQIPHTLEPTPEASTSTTTPATLLVISYTTTIKLPELNLSINADQHDDPELENIISSVLLAEMPTLLVSATARSVSQSPAEGSAVGQVISTTSTEFPASVSTSLAKEGGGWRDIVEATTTISIGEGKVDL